MRKIEVLRELQELDSVLDQARSELEGCRPRLGDDSELVPLREEREAAARKLRALQEKGRALDWELEDRTAKRKADEKKLYGGSVKNPKDLTSLAQEVENERQQISRLEDQALMNMDAVEAASAEMQTAEGALREREQAWKAEQTDLEAQCGSLDRQVEEVGRRRSEVAGQVDSATLRTYESIRRTRGGLAVVPIEQRTCRGCRITLSSSEVQRARSSPDLVTCQSCGRILYVP